MDKNILKKVVYTIGKFIGILGLLFVLYVLSQEYTLSSFSEQFLLIIEILPILFILNFLSSIVGIYAWHMMLLNYTNHSFGYLYSYYYFAKTEIAKYLPGNVFHFIGRQALASKVGITQMQMAKISLLFSLLLLVSTILSSTFFTLFTNGIENYILILMLLTSVVTFIAIIFTYTSFPIQKKIQINLLLALSVALQGFILASIVLYQVEIFNMELFLQCTSIYIISWLIGFITPGASGGLGVREGTFIAIVSFLHVDISSEIIVFSVLLVRLINILVDIALFISTFLIKSKINTTPHS